MTHLGHKLGVASYASWLELLLCMPSILKDSRADTLSASFNGMHQNQPKRQKKISAAKFARMQWDPGLRERKTITDYLAAALRSAIYDGQFGDQEELNQV